MAKISANGATKVATVTQRNDNTGEATRQWVLCSDGRWLVRTRYSDGWSGYTVSRRGITIEQVRDWANRRGFDLKVA